MNEWWGGMQQFENRWNHSKIRVQHVVVDGLMMYFLLQITTICTNFINSGSVGLLNIFSLSYFFFFFSLSLTHKHTQALKNHFTFTAHSYLKVCSITEKKESRFSSLIIYNWKTNKSVITSSQTAGKKKYFLDPNCCKVQHTAHLSQPPLKFVHTQCKQAITGRVFSGNLQELFVSVQRLQSLLSEREGSRMATSQEELLRLKVGV